MNIKLNEYNVLNELDNNSVTLNSRALFINPDITGYIPHLYATNHLYLNDDFLSSDLEFKKRIPVLITNSFLIPSGRIRHNPYLDNVTFQGEILTNRGSSSYIRAQGILFDPNMNLVYCVSYETDFIRSLFNKLKQFIVDSLSYNMLINYPEEIAENDLIRLLSYEFFSKNYKTKEFVKNNTTLFINESLFNTFNSGISVTIESFSQGYKDVVVDNIEDYFVSSNFATIEDHVFDTIDGPQKLLYESL